MSEAVEDEGRPEWTPKAFIRNIIGDLAELEIQLLNAAARDDRGVWHAKEAQRFIEKMQANLNLYFAEVRRREAKRSGSG